MQEDNTFKKKRDPLKRKRGGGKRMNRDKRREQRHEEAVARQALHDALTLDEKIAKATPGSKEMMRLESMKEDAA